MNGNYDDYKLHLVGEQNARDAIYYYKPSDYNARSFSTSRKINNPKLSNSGRIKRGLVAVSVVLALFGGEYAIHRNFIDNLVKQEPVVQNVDDENYSDEQRGVQSAVIPASFANKEGVRVEVDSNGTATIVDENGRYGSLNGVSAEECAKLFIKDYQENIKSQNRLNI